jgi:hypothetical protein
VGNLLKEIPLDVNEEIKVLETLDEVMEKSDNIMT